MTSRCILALTISEFQFGTFRVSMLSIVVFGATSLSVDGESSSVLFKSCILLLCIDYLLTFCIFICKTLISNVVFSASFDCTALCLVSFCIRIPVSPVCLAFDILFLMNVQFLKLIIRLAFNLVSKEEAHLGFVSLDISLAQLRF